MNRLICYGLGTILILNFNLNIVNSCFYNLKTPAIRNSVFTIVPEDTSRCFIISGSFLIPQNADNQLKILKNQGFNKAYKYNFPQTEYYSVVVDSFNPGDTLHKILIEQLLRSKQTYFIKCR